MYAGYFGFNAKPFQITTDPRFLWFGEQYKEALAILRYGIQENKGVIALSGGVGTGKTTLINALMCRIKNDVIAAVVSDPGLEPVDFFSYIAHLYGITSKVHSKADFLFHFDIFLKNALQRKKKVLLVVDEAQRLAANLMEEIRLLSNLEISGQRLLNVFLVGQNELKAMLLIPENRSLKQRIAMHFNITPLTLDEVRAYVGYRLAVAGREQQIFTDGAISEIYAFSKGYPRLINTICDLSLIGAFVKNSRNVTADMVANSANEIRIPNQAQSDPPISKRGVNASTIARPAPIALPFKHQKGKKRISTRAEKEKKRFPFLQLSSIGIALALFIFSGYLLNQHRIDAKPRTTNAQSRLPLQITAPPIADTLIPLKVSDSSRRSSVFTEHVTVPAESPRLPIPADAPQPSQSGDKDPGAIIDWLIQKKKQRRGE